MKNYYKTLLIILVFSTQINAQEISRSFELRYFKNDTSANGITDFHGETEVFNTGQRINFLRQYSKIASAYFNDTELNKKVVSSADKQTFLNQFKPQPTSEIRKRTDTKVWKWIGCREGAAKERKLQSVQWEAKKGVKIINGRLLFEKDNMSIDDIIPLQKWRFYFQWDVTISDKKAFAFSLSNGQETALTVGVNSNRKIFYSSGENIIHGAQYKTGRTANCKLEVDLINNAYNFYINNSLAAGFVPLKSKEIVQINHFTVSGNKGLILDNIWGVGFKPQDKKHVPYSMNTFIDETFEPGPHMMGWFLSDYDDSCWKETILPKVHGGERFAGESLYLRKKMNIGEFQRAELNVETIDPGGEIYVNGKIVDVVHNRYPINLDITDYLIPNAENLIAFRVKPHVLSVPMGHAPSDHNTGWFLGRVQLELTAKTFINEILVNADNVNNPALMMHKIEIVNDKKVPFSGNVLIKYYPWFPDESDIAVTD
ncbi:MAG: hypothetical protein KAR38_13125, partial [Calditrichia bacterium]|nr:hypothetical protein [Calditrichia bacterium]